MKLKYDLLRGLCTPESKDGNYEVHTPIGRPKFTDLRTGNCRKSKQGQPLADETLLGWPVHKERMNDDQSCFIQTRNEDYEQLYRFFGGSYLGKKAQVSSENMSGKKSVKEVLKENTYLENVMGLVSTEEEAKKFKGKQQRL